MISNIHPYVQVGKLSHHDETSPNGLRLIDFPGFRNIIVNRSTKLYFIRGKSTVSSEDRHPPLCSKKRSSAKARHIRLRKAAIIIDREALCIPALFKPKMVIITIYIRKLVLQSLFYD